jgi:hypothetical protein
VHLEARRHHIFENVNGFSRHDRFRKTRLAPKE